MTTPRSAELTHAEFARLVFDQTIDTWRVLGGVPAVMGPDNLEAAVIRHLNSRDRAEGASRRVTGAEFARSSQFRARQRRAS